MHYYGTRLSENISRREPEGYLCTLPPVSVLVRLARQYRDAFLGSVDARP